MNEWFVSSDSHLVEPPNLIVDRIDKKFRAEAPHVETIDGHEWMCVEDIKLEVYVPARAGDRFLPMGVRRQRRTFVEDVRAGAYDPVLWLEDNERDGVFAGVIQPSHLLVMYSVRDSGLLSAMLRVWNDWSTEFAGSSPNRIKAIGALNVDDVEAAVQEMQRFKALGAAGALIPVRPLDSQTYDSEAYEPLWAAAAEMGMPLLLHTATARPAISKIERFGATGMVCTSDYWLRRSVTSMIFSGVFERHPDLRIVSVENEGGWAPAWLRRMDWHYLNNFRLNRPGYMRKFSNGAMPSDLARRNFMISFSEDDILVSLRHELGVEQLMWSTDYPHAEGLFPRTREFSEQLFSAVPDSERTKMVRDNAVRLFGFDSAQWNRDPAYLAGPQQAVALA